MLGSYSWVLSLGFHVQGFYTRGFVLGGFIHRGFHARVYLRFLSKGFISGFHTYEFI